MDWKKLGWRFTRGAVYVFGAGVTAKYTPVLDGFIGQGATAAAIGGLLLAIDKYFGFGGLVKPATTK